MSFARRVLQSIGRGYPFQCDVELKQYRIRLGLFVCHHSLGIPKPLCYNVWNTHGAGQHMLFVLMMKHSVTLLECILSTTCWCPRARSSWVASQMVLHGVWQVTTLFPSSFLFSIGHLPLSWKQTVWKDAISWWCFSTGPPQVWGTLVNPWIFDLSGVDVIHVGTLYMEGCRTGIICMVNALNSLWRSMKRSGHLHHRWLLFSQHLATHISSGLEVSGTLRILLVTTLLWLFLCPQKY